MTVLQLVVALYIAGAGLAWSGYCAWVFTTKSLGPKPDWTSWLVFRSGQALLWILALAVAGAIFGAVAWTVSRALGAA